MNRRLKIGDTVEVYMRRGVFRWAPAVVQAVGDVRAVVWVTSLARSNRKDILLAQEGKAWRRQQCPHGAHELAGPPAPFCCEERKRAVLKLEAGEHPTVSEDKPKRRPRKR